MRTTRLAGNTWDASETRQDQSVTTGSLRCLPGEFTRLEMLQGIQPQPVRRTLALLGACVAGFFLPAHAWAGTSAAVLEAEQDARQAFQHGDYPLAIRLYEDCRTQTPDDPRLLTNLGLAYFQNNQLDAAVQPLRRAIRLAPGEEVAYRALGVVYYWQRNDKEAVTVLEQAALLAPHDAVARKYLALAHARQGGKRRTYP